MAGSFTFKWAQPAEEVYVTGSFDDWGKSTKLNKEGDAFIATVSLPSEKILYKYVVDGNWTVDTTARREAGDDGIENNVLLPEDLVGENTEPDMSSATISSAAPNSTTAALAAQVPKETNGDVKDATISSVSPDSTTAALAAGVSEEARTPSLKNVPGGFPQTSATETSDPHGDANQVPPGEPTPKHDDSSEDLSGGVKLDPNSPPEARVLKIVEDSQEKAGVPPEASAVPEVVEQKKEVEQELKEGVPAGLGSASGEGSEGTTPATAPDLVKRSQEAAHVSPEASAVESAVEGKKEFENELKREVSPVPPVRDLAENPAASAVSPVGEPVKPTGQAPEVEDSPAMAGRKDEVEPVAPVQSSTTDNAATSTAPVPKLEVTDPQEATTPLPPTTPVEPTKNGTPKNGSPRKSVENGNGEPPASPTQLTKKKNRFSFLGNLKEKLHFGKDKGKSKGVAPIMIRKVHVLLFLIVFLLVRQTVIHAQRTMGREGKLGMRALWNSVSVVAIFQSCMGTVSGFGSRVWGTIVPAVRSPLRFFHLSSS